MHQERNLRVPATVEEAVVAADLVVVAADHHAVVAADVSTGVGEKTRKRKHDGLGNQKPPKKRPRLPNRLHLHLKLLQVLLFWQVVLAQLVLHVRLKLGLDLSLL